MTNPVEETPTWWDKLKKAMSAQTVILAMLVLGYVGEKVWGYIEVGAKTEFQADVATTFTATEGTPFYNAVDSVVTMKVTDPEMISMLLESSEVKEAQHQAAEDIRNTIIEDVMKKDTNKISMRSFLGMKTGLRDEDVLPALGALLDAHVKGEIMTKKEADAHIKKALRIAKF
jgi:hypothetical protein